LVAGAAGAGVLIGAAPLGVLEVVGSGGVSSVFLQPPNAANAAKTTVVANIVLRINIDSPL
jgi:ribosomal protein S5